MTYPKSSYSKQVRWMDGNDQRWLDRATTGDNCVSKMTREQIKAVERNKTNIEEVRSAMMKHVIKPTAKGITKFKESTKKIGCRPRIPIRLTRYIGSKAGSLLRKSRP